MSVCTAGSEKPETRARFCLCTTQSRPSRLSRKHAGTTLANRPRCSVSWRGRHLAPPVPNRSVSSCGPSLCRKRATTSRRNPGGASHPAAAGQNGASTIATWRALARGATCAAAVTASGCSTCAWRGACQEGRPCHPARTASLFGSAQAGGSSSRTCSEFCEAPGSSVGAARAQGGQCVGPGGPVSCRGTLGALQAQAAQTSRQHGEPACCSIPRRVKWKCGGTNVGISNYQFHLPALVLGGGEYWKSYVPGIRFPFTGFGTAAWLYVLKTRDFLSLAFVGRCITNDKTKSIPRSRIPRRLHSCCRFLSGQVCGIHEPEKIGTIPETGVGLKTRKNPRERIEVATGRENQGERARDGPFSDR